MRFSRILNYFLILPILVLGMPLGVMADDDVPVLISAPVQTTYLSDVDVDVGITSLRIMAGSVQEGLTIEGNNLTVTVPENEAFIIRSIYTKNWVLENNGGLETCNAIYTQDNQTLVQGPKTVTISPSVFLCTTIGYDTDQTPFVSLDAPIAGQELDVGQQVQLFWQTTGLGADAVRIRLSTDNGATFSEDIASGLINNGFYQWTVPTVYTTDQAILKIEGMDGSGNIRAIDLSPVFRIEGEDPPPEPDPPAWNFDPTAVTAIASSIDLNQGLIVPEGAGEPPCAAGLRVKAKISSAVYYCGSDGKRHAFPNQWIHASWYGESGNWGGVVEITDESLASISLGANITYRPGVRMVKITTDPKTYVVDAGNILRWVPSEEAAVALYGENWNQMIDDLPDAFFADYTIGDPVEFK